MNREPDPRLDDILDGEPELGATARRVHDALQGPPADPAYRTRLHNLLLAERARVIEQQRQEQRPDQPPRRRRRQRPWWQVGPAAGRLAPALAVALAVVLAIAIVPHLLGGGTAPVSWSSAVSGQSAASPSAPVVVHFSQPMDHATVESALQISPATRVQTTWQGDDLVITPVNGLAPGVPYEVSLAADRARTSTGAAPAHTLRFWFGTGPSVAAASDTGPFGQAAQAFAAAQVARDDSALQGMSGPQVSLPTLPSLDRAWVVWVDPGSATTATAEVQLLVDGWSGNPRTQVATEELHLAQVGDAGRVEVQSLTVGSFGDLPAGPHIVHIGVSGHTLQVTYNCDMDPGSIAASNQVLGPDGQQVQLSTSYDAATRTVTVHVPTSVSGPVQLTVTRGLRDIHHQNLANPFQTAFTLS